LLAGFLGQVPLPVAAVLSFPLPPSAAAPRPAFWPPRTVGLAAPSPQLVERADDIAAVQPLGYAVTGIPARVHFACRGGIHAAEDGRLRRPGGPRSRWSLGPPS